MSLENFIIYVFCLVDDLLKKILKEIGKLRQRGFTSLLDDAEVITMEIVGEYQGIDTDTGILKYFDRHWRHLFPKLPTRCNFSRQAANLVQVKKVIHRRLAAYLCQRDEIFLTDGVPIPICHLKRANQCKLFRGDAGFGYCATKEEYYYGFKALVVTTLNGAIVDYTVGEANIDERQALFDCAETVRGCHGIGDKGFIGKDYKDDLFKEFGITLHTLLRSNMKDDRPREFLKTIVSVRRLVETVIGQLTERLNINQTWARTIFRFTNRIVRKILTHTLAVFMLRQAGGCDLKIECLVGEA